MSPENSKDNDLFRIVRAKTHINSERSKRKLTDSRWEYEGGRGKGTFSMPAEVYIGDNMQHYSVDETFDEISGLMQPGFLGDSGAGQQEPDIIDLRPPKRSLPK